MPKAGRYELPVIALDDAVERLRKIRDVVGGRVATREVAAEAMDMSPDGGQTQYIIAAMADYGLIETGSGEIKTTDLAELILFGDSTEVSRAKVKAVANVELFSRIFAKYGPSPSDDQVRAFLRQDALVDIAKVPELTDRLRKMLGRLSPYAAAIPESQSRSKTEAMQTDQTHNISDGLTNVKGDFMEVRIGDHYFKLPLDDLDLAGTLAKTNIDGIIASLKARKSMAERTGEQGKDS